MINPDGTVFTEAWGNNGVQYSTASDMVADLQSILPGLGECDGSDTACLAGIDYIDDLAKFNLTFFIDPTGYQGEQFTLRFESVATSVVPEPATFALLGMGSLMLIAGRRRR